MIEFLRKAPFFRLLLTFSVGIIFRLCFPVNSNAIIYSILLTFILWFGLIFLNKIAKNIQYQGYFGFVVYVFLFLQGIFVTSIKIDSIEKQYFPSYQKIDLTCILTDFPDERTKSFKYLVSTLYYTYNYDTIPCNFNIILYLEKSVHAANLKPGDVLLVKVKPQKIKSFPNDKDFDYAKYMFKQGVIYSAYANSQLWNKIDSNKLSFFPKLGYKCRSALLNLLRKSGLKGNDYAVASALTIGYRADMDPEIREAYSATGTMHILAVSGMHVGLLYLVLSFLFGYFERFKYGIYFKSVIILVLIWFYAFICGLSPSILRAALMLTFIGIGQTINRQSFIFNSIAVSAFLILIYDPLQITDVGFQLSYAAVAGIVIFYPLIYQWFYFKIKALDYVWQLTAVSLAAQTLTFPLTIYYFKQFPVYFLLSNILAIPVSTLAMYSALLLAVAFFIPQAISFLGIILQFFVNLQNKIVLLIQYIPGSQINNISVTILDVFFFYLLILFFSLTLIKRKAYLIIGLLLIILAFQIKGIFEII